MPLLVKTQTVLMLGVVAYPGQVEFASAPGEPNEDTLRNHVLKLDINVWKDMGSPEVITMTVESGDNLNG